MKPQDDVKPDEGQSRSTAGLERKPVSFANFIEMCGGFKLKPYQLKLVEAVERGEKLMLEPATLREPYSEWKKRYREYVNAMWSSNGLITATRTDDEKNDAA